MLRVTAKTLPSDYMPERRYHLVHHSQCYHFRISKHDSFFSPTTTPLLMMFKRPTTGPSLAPRDYPGPLRAKQQKGPNLLLLLGAN